MSVLRTILPIIAITFHTVFPDEMLYSLMDRYSPLYDESRVITFLQNAGIFTYQTTMTSQKIVPPTCCNHRLTLPFTVPTIQVCY